MSAEQRTRLRRHTERRLEIELDRQQRATETIARLRADDAALEKIERQATHPK